MINPKELSIEELKVCYYAYRKILRDNEEWRTKHRERKRKQRAKKNLESK